MRFIHKPLVSMKKGTLVKVTFSQPTKVKLMTTRNFDKYKKGRTHQYFGGHYDASPIEFTIPTDGNYNCVIEKGSFNSPIDVTGDVEIAGMAKRKRKIEAAPEAAEDALVETNETNAETEATTEPVAETEESTEQDTENTEEERQEG